MLNVSWKYLMYKGSKQPFIEFVATWDGRLDNDPCVLEGELERQYWTTPFVGSLFESDVIFEDKENRIYGEIIAVSPVSTAIISMLENQKDIHRWSGNTHPFQYRANLLSMLHSLYD